MVPGAARVCSSAATRKNLAAADGYLDSCWVLSSHQSKYAVKCVVLGTSAPGPVDPRRNTSSCPNTPKASGDVHGPLKTLATSPRSRFLYKLKTGFLTLLRAVFAALARDKLQGASRTVESTTTDGWRGTPHE